MGSLIHDGVASPAGPAVAPIARAPHLMVLAPDREVDTEELAVTADLLNQLAGEITALLGQLDQVDSGVAGAAASYALGHHFTAFHGRVSHLRDGHDGLVVLAGELERLAWRVSQVRYLYDDTEGVVTRLFTAPSLAAEHLGLVAVSRFGEEPGRLGTVGPLLGLPRADPDALLMLFHPRIRERLRDTIGQAPHWQFAQDLVGISMLLGSLVAMYWSSVSDPEVPNIVIARNNVDHLSGYLPGWGSPLVERQLQELGLPAPGEEHNDVQATALTTLAWMHMVLGPARFLLGTAPLGGFEAVRSVPVNSRGERRHGNWPGIPLTEGDTRAGTPLDTGPKVVPVGFGTAIEPLDTAAVLRRFDTVNDHHDATGTGTIEIVSTTTADGSRGWTVLIPGTKDWMVGSSQVMDMDTNTAGVAGEQTHMSLAVAQAMDQVGIQPGEPVSLFGHSQGGIVAAELSADPILQSQYDISSVVTFGSPTGQIDIPENTAALHLVNSQDPVAGLSGVRDPAEGNRVTVAQLNPHSSNPVATHELHPYIGLAERLHELDDPRLDHVQEVVGTSFGAGRAVTSTRAYTFEVERY